MRCVYLLFLLVFVFMISFVSAKDVAYIYQNGANVDKNIITVFNNMGLDIDLVRAGDPSIDFSNYRMLYIGDESFNNWKDILVNDMPSVVMNYRYGHGFGLTDRDGISEIFSSAPLSVQMGGVVNVYKNSPLFSKLGIKYYYLDDANRVSVMKSVAGVAPVSSGRNIGDVISYVDSGEVMKNGKTQVGNLCFFGIVESDLWTDDAREMFRECVNFALNTKSDKPVCSKDSDCGENYSGKSYCKENGVYNKKINFMCENAGTRDSVCIENSEDIIVNNCTNGCFEGDCILSDEQKNNSGVHDVGFYDFANSVNMIRLKDSDGNDVNGSSLLCNEKYKVIIGIENKGNFSENVSFEGNVGDIKFSHLALKDFMPQEKKIKTRTVSLNLIEGTYDLTIEAIIDEFSDNNSENNIISRKIFVSCL